jgi:hypothetical protein
MRIREYRNQKISAKLEAGVKSWQSQGGMTEKRSCKSWRHIDASWFLYLFPIPGILGAGEIFAALILPFGAAIVYGRLGGFQREIASEPMSYLLPIPEALMTQRLRHSFLITVCLGVIWAFGCGLLIDLSKFPNVPGAYRSMVISVSLLSVFFLIPSSWAETLQSIVISCFGLMIVALWFAEPARIPLYRAIESLPWISILRSGSYLWIYAILALSGLLFACRKRICQIVYPRDLFYEFTEMGDDVWS